MYIYAVCQIVIIYQLCLGRYIVSIVSAQHYEGVLEASEMDYYDAGMTHIPWSISPRLPGTQANKIVPSVCQGLVDTKMSTFAVDLLQNAWCSTT